jgi:hypothetical protein
MSAMEMTDEEIWGAIRDFDPVRADLVIVTG